MNSTVHTGVSRYGRLLAYEVEATRRALTSIESVPAEGRRHPGFERAIAVMSHVQLARFVWLARVEGRPYENPKDWFPVWTLEQTRLAAQEQDREWAEFLHALSDGDLGTTVGYTSSEGEAKVRVLDDILTHVFNHSTYHRGQVARLVQECGGARAVTDYITLVPLLDQ
ncbi:MAG TPA: DinB family protein [Phycisphaerales bacterium]|nr:DinB family protein [Phycisphaerales bacterium]